VSTFYASDEAFLASLEEDPDAVLSRFWEELKSDPHLAPIAAFVPSNRSLTILDAIPLVPAVMPYLSTSADQLRVLDAAVHAYLRAAGLHISEE